jgi:hypothetical protein
VVILTVGRMGNWNYIFATYVKFSLLYLVLTCPETPPAAYLIYTGRSFCGINRPGRQADNAVLSTVKFKSVLGYTYTPFVSLNGVVLS